MATIRTRAQLASLLERQMAAASARAPNDRDDIDARTALKTYLLEAHGRLRAEPAAALTELASLAGLVAQPTDEPELVALTQGELSFWLDTTNPRFPRLYTSASVKDADRVHDALVAASAMLEPVYLLPEQLESLPERVGGKAVLFSLRHDRRPLRREPARGQDEIDFVTLRLWAPSALATLSALRKTQVLPGATSVSSIRVRGGDEQAYAVVEVFSNGKFTSVGSSFALHDKVVRTALEGYAAMADAVEAATRAGQRVTVALNWSTTDLAYAAVKLLGGGEPFRLWGLPWKTQDETFRARVVDLDVGRTATLEVGRQGAVLELNPDTPASTAVRLVAALQYHVHAEARADVLSEPVNVPRTGRARRGRVVPFDERATLDEVARAVLAEACAQYVRGVQTLTAQSLLAGTHGESGPTTPAEADLVRQVMAEAAAYEWRERLKPILATDGSTQWRWNDPPPSDSTIRTRDLVRLNKQAQQLVARVSGGVEAPWLQLSLFGAEELVPPSPENE